MSQNPNAVTQIRRYDEMAENNEDKKGNQGNSSTFISFHTSWEIQNSNLKPLRKPPFIPAKCFDQPNFTEFSLNVHWKRQCYLCFKAGKLSYPLLCTGLLLASLMACTTGILTPVGFPFVRHKLNEVVVTRIELEVLTDVDPLDYSSIITCFQRQIVHCFTCSQNKSENMMLLHLLSDFFYSRLISFALLHGSSTGSSLQLLLRNQYHCPLSLCQNHFSYTHYFTANLTGSSVTPHHLSWGTISHTKSS